MNKEHLFLYNQELIDYIKKEIMKYINIFTQDKVLYNYNRMTVEELTQDTLLKVWKSVGRDKTINKAFVRSAARHVCIDAWRKKTDIDLDVLVVDNEEDIDKETKVYNSLLMSLDPEDIYRDSERELVLKHFQDKDLKILLKLIEGYNSTETLESIGVSRSNYYHLVKKYKKFIN